MEPGLTKLRKNLWAIKNKVRHAKIYCLEVDLVSVRLSKVPPIISKSLNGFYLLAASGKVP